MSDDDLKYEVWDPVLTQAGQAHIEKLRASIEPHLSVMRGLRSSLGLTQVEVAKLLGTTQANVSKMEKRGEANLAILSRIAEAKLKRLSLVVESEQGVVEQTICV